MHWAASFNCSCSQDEWLQGKQEYRFEELKEKYVKWKNSTNGTNEDSDSIIVEPDCPVYKLKTLRSLTQMLEFTRIDNVRCYFAIIITFHTKGHENEYFQNNTQAVAKVFDLPFEKNKSSGNEVYINEQIYIKNIADELMKKVQYTICTNSERHNKHDLNIVFNEY